MSRDIIALLTSFAYVFAAIGVAERGQNPPPLLAQVFLKMIHPHVAVVNVAQIRLHLLDRADHLVELAVVDRPGDLHGVAEAVDDSIDLGEEHLGEDRDAHRALPCQLSP